MVVTEIRSRVFLIEGANYCARTFSGRLDVPSREFTHRVNGTEAVVNGNLWVGTNEPLILRLEDVAESYRSARRVLSKTQ